MLLGSREYIGGHGRRFEGMLSVSALRFKLEVETFVQMPRTLEKDPEIVGHFILGSNCICTYIPHFFLSTTVYGKVLKQIKIFHLNSHTSLLLFNVHC